MKKIQIFISMLLGIYSLQSFASLSSGISERQQVENARHKKLLKFLITKGMDGDKTCFLTSEIVPYIKILKIWANLGDNLVPVIGDACWSSPFIARTNVGWVYTRRIVADLRNMYVKAPEEFARESVFSGENFITSAEVSDLVMQTPLPRDKRDKILDIIHCIKEGTIERSDEKGLDVTLGQPAQKLPVYLSQYKYI